MKIETMLHYDLYMNRGRYAIAINGRLIEEIAVSNFTRADEPTSGGSHATVIDGRVVGATSITSFNLDTSNHDPDTGNDARLLSGAYLLPRLIASGFRKGQTATPGETINMELRETPFAHEYDAWIHAHTRTNTPS